MRVLPTIAIAAALSLGLGPVAVHADKNRHSAQHIQKKAKNKAPQFQLLNVQAKPCPPGLAKKDPACIPPGQAKKAGVQVGKIYDGSVIHIVTKPGLYGLGPLVPGSRYAVIGNQLVRIDPQTNKVLSIIRLVDAILD